MPPPNKLGLLLKKNLTERKRNLVSTLSEVLVPLAFIFLLVWLQHFDKDSEVKERDYTCPQQTAISPTLLSSEEFLRNASAAAHKKDNFIIAMDTAGAGAGLQTVPPFLYVLALAAKMQSKIALIAEDNASKEWFANKFVKVLDDATKPLEGARWQEIRKALDVFDIPLCRFSKLIKYYPSSQQLDEYVTSEEYGTGEWQVDKQHHCPLPAAKDEKPKLFAAIVLSHQGASDFTYTVRMNFTAVPPTYPTVPFVNPLLVGVDPKFQDSYVLSGFLTLQLQMDRHLIGIKHKGKSSDVKRFAIRSLCDSIDPMLRDLQRYFPDKKQQLKKFNCEKLFTAATLGADLSPLLVPASFAPNQVRIAPFPTPDYSDRPFYAKIESIMSLVLLLCYQWPASRLIRGIVHEKESGLRESLLQMGVGLVDVMASHLITYTVVFTIIALLITLISSFHLFSESDASIVLCFFMLFGLNVVTFGFFISVLFDRAKTASTAGVSVFFMTYLPYFALASQQATLGAKSALSLLFAPTAFGLGVTTLAHYESSGEGVHWSNAHTAPAENDLAFTTILLHMAVTVALYLFLGWYCNQVVQSEFGVARRPWYFLATRQYWFGDDAPTVTRAAEYTDLETGGEVDTSYFEPPSEEMKQLEVEGRCLQTYKLRKEFPSADGAVKVAVHDFTATFYEGQICALLGPNGCGKTTMIRMLTGNMPSTSGEAQLGNRDLFQHMDELRQHLGVCPQHDVLFEDLTVGEHLELVARLKNVDNVELAVTGALDKIGMPEKRHRLSNALSGGQKRKLSLAMALLGDSKFVFLDEPTSGMDSYSRRFVWNLLQDSKQGRIIVLTTHFLDEADYLGDQILIMGNGRLKCSGTSHFLKQKYGVGYTLTVQHEARDIVSRQVPEAKLLSAMGSEDTFQVPFASSQHFPQLFAKLDAAGKQGYGVSVTTLDEVFVKVALEGDENWANAESARMQARLENKPLLEDNNKGVHYATGWEQFSALFVKRAKYASRDRRSVCCNTFIPVILLILGLGMLKLFPLPQPPALELTEHTALQANGDGLQVVVDSERLAAHVPHSLLYVRNTSRAYESNNCSQDFNADSYYDALALKAFSTFLREDQFHRKQQQPMFRFGAIHVDRDDTDGIVSATIFANSSAMHSTAVYMNVLNQALLESHTDHATAATISISNHPFHFTARFQALLSTLSAISASISTLMAFSFIPASIAIYVVREREVSAKHQQLLAGTSLFAYWLANFAFDFAMFCIPWCCGVVLVFAFGISALENIAVVVLFGCYGVAIIPFTYLTSFYFHSHSTAQNVVLLLNFITGMVLTITSFVLSLISSSTQQVNDWLVYVFRLFPGFCLGNGLFNLTVNDSAKTFGDGVFVKAVGAFDWDVTGAALCFLLVESVVFFALTLLVDFYCSDPYVRSKLQQVFMFTKREADSNSTQQQQPLLLDEDVAKEMERIDSGEEGEDEDVVRCHHLRKVWPSTGQVAVKDVTFGIQRGTVFGLLGVNGSGKTSVLKMLSGEILPTSGTATINGLDILLDQQRVRRMIGYVPQFDALLDLLTVREHLELYGKLKGLRSAQQLEQNVLQKMHELRLEEFEHKCAGTLSGGNKRKLSVAVALIGDPMLILADEPTTGVDALNRRFLCDTLAAYSKHRNAAIVLTTHSFEEVESMSSTVGILYAGQFKMLGSIQHLKNRFGKGIVFRVKLGAPTSQRVEAVVKQLDGHMLDSLQAMEQACTTLGISERVKEISAEGSGWVLHAALERDHVVPPSLFAHWWIAQCDSERFVQEFVQRNFPQATLAAAVGSGKQTHSAVAQQFSYQVEQLDNRTLGECFALFEQAKQEFNLQEYSISGTSLESIFINLAQHAEDDR